MTTPAGTISMSQVRSELGRSGPISFGDTTVRELAFAPGVAAPRSGAIGLADMRGRTKYPPGNLFYFLEGTSQWSDNNLVGVGLKDNGVAIGTSQPSGTQYILSGTTLYCRNAYVKDVAGIGGSISKLYAFIRIQS
jgi:hypothetical protein